MFIIKFVSFINLNMALWSSGLGRRPLTAETGVRVPIGSPNSLCRLMYRFFYCMNYKEICRNWGYCLVLYKKGGGLDLSLSTVVSLVIGFIALIAAFMLDGGNPLKLIQPTAALIVFGGIIGAIGVSFPAEDLKRIPKILGVAFKNRKKEFDGLIEFFKDIAIKTRKDGLLTLEQEIANIENILIKKGLQMIVDGVNPENVRDILEEQANTIYERHKVGISIFEAAGGFAPTMGIIGTVMGLVHVLANLSDPESLGPKISTAFVATLYGVSFANLVFLPIANKLKSLNRAEDKENQIIIEAVLSVQEGISPNTLVEKLNSFLDK